MIVGIDHKYIACLHGVDANHLEFVWLGGDGIHRFGFGGEDSSAWVACRRHGTKVGAEGLVAVFEGVEHI